MCCEPSNRSAWPSPSSWSCSRRSTSPSRRPPTRSFSESLDHTGGLYLTITVFSTVGFGDITPETDLARVVVSVQMLLDLVVIGAVAKLILNAAKSGMDDDV